MRHSWPAQQRAGHQRRVRAAALPSSGGGESAPEAWQQDAAMGTALVPLTSGGAWLAGQQMQQWQQLAGGASLRRLYLGSGRRPGRGPSYGGGGGRAARGRRVWRQEAAARGGGGGEDQALEGVPVRVGAQLRGMRAPMIR